MQLSHSPQLFWSLEVIVLRLSWLKDRPKKELLYCIFEKKPDWTDSKFSFFMLHIPLGVIFYELIVLRSNWTKQYISYFCETIAFAGFLLEKRL